MKRRDFIRAGISIGLGTALTPRFVHAADTAAAVEQAHSEIWRRFIDKQGVMIDFTALDGSVDLPTPEECRQGMPNALGWWSPIENGAMFNGLYLDAAVNRWQQTKSGEAAARTRRLMEGLLLLNSVSDVKGFVGRGVSTDGKSHYPMGSNDQTFPWFYGLWRYLESGLATPPERDRIILKLSETADVLLKNKWAMPAEQPFGQRGSFAGFSFESAPRLLFVCKIMHAVTRQANWDKLYRQALSERGGMENASRLETCERGMVFDYAPYHSWTSCSCVGAIRSLWELEQNETVKAAYARGLQASADLAMKSLPLAEKFHHDDPSTFSPEWRMMNQFWKLQQTEKEAQELAQRQLKEFLKVSPRRSKETEFVREPTAAAWIVTLAPDVTVLRQRAHAVMRVIAHYDYTRLYYSQFFWVESAWWRLQDLP